MSNIFRQYEILLQALSSDKSKIGFLLGAGCPTAIKCSKGEPLIKNILGLTEIIRRDGANEGIEGIFARIKTDEKPATIEDALTHVRLLQEVVGDGQIDGFTKEKLDNLEKCICDTIQSEVSPNIPHEITPYHQLASWIQSTSRNFPIEIFTPNYDILIESIFESRKIPYFDGFIGSNKAFFDLHAIEYDVIPVRWTRVWKLHGSINWWRDSNNDVYRGASQGGKNKPMIFPSHLKYDQSRKMPYLAMQDRLGTFLASGQPVLVVIGYSFVDQHLNEIINQRLTANPNAICVGLLYDPIEKYPEAIANARKITNLTLIAKNGCISGSKKRLWSIAEYSDESPLAFAVKAIKNEQGTITEIQSLLGDFSVFGELLLEQVGNFSLAANDDAAND